jgi:ABC-2 type transport system permease protein
MLAALIRKEFLALLRDPQALGALFLMPAAFLIIMSLALENMYAPPLKTLAYAVEAGEQTPLARRLLATWQNTHGTPRPLAADWPEALHQGRLAYVLRIEPGLAEALAALEEPAAPLLQLHADPGLDQNALRLLQAELAGTLGELRGMALQAALTGDSPRTSPSILPFLATSLDGQKHLRPSNPVQQNVPAWLVFGMFFVVTAISSLFIEEQRNGTLARLAAIGVPDHMQILAKALPYIGVNGMQTVLMLAVGTHLMPALGAGALSLAEIDWPALLLMLAATSCAAIGCGLLLACIARTHSQANTLGPFCNLLMASLGGIMVPTFVMPPAMQHLSRLSPMNWGLEGLLTVLLRHGDAADIAPWALRLALFGAATLLIASRLFSRRIQP